MATEPNCNHVFSFPREGGGTTRFIHDLPLTLKHHYPLPAIGTSEIPLFQGESASTARPIKADWHCALALGHRSGSRENTNSTLRNSSASSRLERRTGWTIEYSVSTSETRYRNPPGQITVARSNRSGTSWTEDQIDAAEVGSPDDLDELTFFILNGWQAMDGATTCHEGREHRGRLDAATDNWAIRIDPRGDVTQKAARKHMNATAGHTVTHIGRLRREDGSSFAAAEGLEALTTIEIALSFALGRVTACVLPVGWKDGEPRWSSWGQRRAVDIPLRDGPWLEDTARRDRLPKSSNAVLRQPQSRPDGRHSPLHSVTTSQGHMMQPRK
jgi:hypothetical protein